MRNHLFYNVLMVPILEALATKERTKDYYLH